MLRFFCSVGRVAFLDMSGAIFALGVLPRYFVMGGYAAIPVTECFGDTL